MASSRDHISRLSSREEECDVGLSDGVRYIIILIARLHQPLSLLSSSCTVSFYHFWFLTHLNMCAFCNFILFRALGIAEYYFVFESVMPSCYGCALALAEDLCQKLLISIFAAITPRKKRKCVEKCMSKCMSS